MPMMNLKNPLQTERLFYKLASKMLSGKKTLWTQKRRTI